MMQQKPPSGPRPYAEVITVKAKTVNGLFKIHKQEDRYFFEIPDSLLGRDLLVVNRIAKAAADSRVLAMGYAGDQIGDNVVRFEKGPSNKIFLRSISYQEVSKDSSESGMYRSVLNSNVQPIVAAFDVKAYAKDNKGTVVDVTDFISSDNDVLYFDAGIKKSFSLGLQINDRSYIDDVKAFPTNIEIRVVKTFSRMPSMGMPGMPGMSSQGPSGPVTYELNSSMVLLPKEVMKPRYFDPRVGYFATGYTDFDANPQGIKKISMITRWRLEPKAEDVEKYKRGELVEPKRPIVFYIDPATPKKWVPYLIQGVNDWNVAFEKAGWKNAIMAKEAPTNDSTWSIDDASHSAIVYKPSDIPNASGPHVHDPRSGEILETHVNWYHNVMSLVHHWYFVQTAAVDPKARKMQFDDELMGQLIRFVSSHEVGHTLGLRHNFGSSSTVPVEKLRDKRWVEENGHTPSIMDYARFNYVAQPEDSISEKGLFPRIGAYDKWAIEWGYRWFPDAQTPEAEKPILNKWVVAQLGKNKHLFFGTETDFNDPREQNEDLGDNAMRASAYGIKNLKRVLPNLLEWTKSANEGYGNAKTMYGEVVNQFNRYMGHVTKNIGGITTTYRSVEEPGAVIGFVPKATQKEAMQFLQLQLFTTPVWLLDKKLFDLTGAGDLSTITSLQNSVLNRLLDGFTLDKLVRFEAYDPQKAYTATEMLSDLRKGVWSELATGKSIDIYRRNLQKLYTGKLIALVKPAPSLSNQPMQAPELNKVTDALSVVKGQVKSLVAEIKKALPEVKDAQTRLHLQDVSDRLKDALDPKN
jgi:ribosomal protein S18 acetylase RimI-like enzyme